MSGDSIQAPTQAPRRARSRAEPSSERILRVAARLFRAKGFKGTTVRDIAEDVGILSGSLFHHFSTKEEMLVAIMREAFVSVCIAHEKVLAAQADPVKQLRALIRVEMDAILSKSRQNFHAVLYFDWRDVPQAAMPELTRLRKRYQSCWAKALAGCHEAGRLRCAPDIAEHVIYGALRDVMTWFRKGGRYTTQEFGDAFMRLFIE